MLTVFWLVISNHHVSRSPVHAAAVPIGAFSSSPVTKLLGPHLYNFITLLLCSYELINGLFFVLDGQIAVLYRLLHDIVWLMI